MLSYFVRRLLLTIPTLIVISWIIFGLSKCAVVDPVVAIYGPDLSSGLDPAGQAENYRMKSSRLGLDLPVFYFSLSSTAYPDTLYRIFPLDRRTRNTRLAGQVNNWPLVAAYDRHFSEMMRQANQVPDSLPEKSDLRLRVNILEQTSRTADLDSALFHLRTMVAGLPDNQALMATTDSLQRTISEMQQAARSRHFARPVLHWYGFKNQYHQWMTGFFTGNLGTSLISKRPVSYEIRGRLMPTLALNGLAILLAYCIAVPMGMRMARYKKSRFDRLGKRVLLTLYSFPVFWLGGLLILAFATPGIGYGWIKGLTAEAWIPGRSFLVWLARNADKLILPVFTLLVHILAILALQMRSSMLEVLNQDYIKTARAKGLSERAVYGKHAFKNALFPLITIFGGVFPAIFSGALVIEYLFNYPGMGTKTQSAFFNQDYPVLYAILMISAMLTILGSLVADMLYAWVDPRVRFGQ